MSTPTCKGCGLTPNEIPEYVEAAKEWEMSPTRYVVRMEGTYNPHTDRFYCTDCYCNAGMPLNNFKEQP